MASAYGEPFEKGTAALRFDGAGVRLDGVTSPRRQALITGAAFVGWDGTYSFNADGRRLPVAGHRRVRLPGRAAVRRSSSSRPAAAARSTIPATTSGSASTICSSSSEPVGQVTGTLALRGNELSGEVDAASPRLAITGTGRIALDAQADADLTFRFHDSSLDPYVRLFVPQLSPYTTAVASGSMRVVGELADLEPPARRRHGRQRRHAAVRLRASGTRGPIRLALDQHVVRVQDLQLVGEDTQLRVGGTIALHDRAHRAAGAWRRQPRHPPGLLPRRARLGPRRADGGGRRPAVRAGVLRAAPPSPTAASATSRCRTRSTPSTAPSTSTRAASGWTMSRR